MKGSERDGENLGKPLAIFGHEDEGMRKMTYPLFIYLFILFLVLSKVYSKK
jgi:hypothetical protein